MRIIIALITLMAAGLAHAGELVYPIADGTTQLYKSTYPAFMGVCRLKVKRDGSAFLFTTDRDVRKVFEGPWAASPGVLDLSFGGATGIGVNENPADLRPGLPEARVEIHFAVVNGEIQPVGYQYWERRPQSRRFEAGPTCSGLMPEKTVANSVSN